MGRGKGDSAISGPHGEVVTIFEEEEKIPLPPLPGGDQRSKDLIHSDELMINDPVEFLRALEKADPQRLPQKRVASGWFQGSVLDVAIAQAGHHREIGDAHWRSYLAAVRRLGERSCIFDPTGAGVLPLLVQN